MHNKILAGVAALALALGLSVGVAAPAMANTSSFVYAGGEQALTAGQSAGGAAANILVAEPYIDTANDSHTLMEIAVTDTATGNAVEIGWSVDPGRYGDTQAHLFTGAWLGSTFLGYDASATGYVDYAANSTNVGANLHTVATNATFTNRIKRMYIQHDPAACGSDSTGGWWFNYDANWIGCIKNSSWSGAFTSANKALYFSEVYTNRASFKPCSDAGNGKPGNSAVLPLDATDPAFFASTGWVNPSPSTITNSNTLFATDPAAYDSFSLGSTGNRTFTLGGKGYTSTGTTPGNLGSC